MTRKIPVKIVLAGDGGTGKSTLLKVKNTGVFDYSCDLTIGVDFGCLEVPWEGRNIPVLIYDLGGQKRFQFMHDSYIIGTKAAIILYDLTREKTFHHIPQWLDLLYKENPDIPILVAGSKKDLIQKEDLDYFDKQWDELKRKFNHSFNLQGHVYISSKIGEGINDIFDKLLNKINMIPFFPPIALTP